MQIKTIIIWTRLNNFMIVISRPAHFIGCLPDIFASIVVHWGASSLFVYYRHFINTTQNVLWRNIEALSVFAQHRIAHRLRNLSTDVDVWWCAPVEYAHVAVDRNDDDEHERVLCCTFHTRVVFIVFVHKKCAMKVSEPYVCRLLADQLNVAVGLIVWTSWRVKCCGYAEHIDLCYT